MNHKCTKESFLKNVADHKITIFRDDGSYRHVRYAKPNDGNRSFSLITWPGELCFTGDMGTFVFNRITDMFDFFRTDSGGINLGYWAEKVVSVDRHTGIKEYSADKFKAAIESYLEGENVSEELREQIEDEILRHADDGEYEARQAVDMFDDFEFFDFWEHDLTEYTYRFVWCCRAISWGIAEYDKAKLQGGKKA